MKWLLTLLLVGWLTVSLSAQSANDKTVQETLGELRLLREVDVLETSLSGKLSLTLQIEGPAPLQVTLPNPLLTKETLPLWRVRPQGKPTLEILPNQRIRWRQVIEMTPYLAGQSVPINLAPLTVRAGTGNETKVEWSKPLAIHVTTEVTEVSVKNLRPATGIELLPEEPPAPSDSSFGFVLGFAILGSLILILYRRKGRAVVPELVPHTRKWTQLELERLQRSPLADEEWLQQFSLLLRQFIGASWNLPATRMTTPELMTQLESNPDFSPELLDALRNRLQECDVHRFTSGLVAPFSRLNREEWITWARTWV